MNFIDFVSDQQRNLLSRNYVDTLWCSISDTAPASSSSEEDEEVYRNHIPVEFAKFLKKCTSKLRDLKSCPNAAEWGKLDQRYLSTLIHFALEQEDVNMNGVLYASNMFFLLNVVGVRPMRFFYKATYVKVLKVLHKFARSQEPSSSNVIIFLMDDFKTFLSKFQLPDDVVTSTISIVHEYTYYCNAAFENIATDVLCDNLGYIAFASLTTLTEQLLLQSNNEDKLYAVLLCLTSSLKSATTSNLSRTIKEAHQKNVRLFVRQNVNKFHLSSCCLVSNMLKFVSLCSDYDEFEAIAMLIQQLPAETNNDLITFLQNSMFCDRVESRKHLLNLVTPILHHSPAHETKLKRFIRSEVFLYNVMMLLVDDDYQIREASLKIVAGVSEDFFGRLLLKKLLTNSNNNEINTGSIQNVLHKIIDPSWHKKAVNVNYIQLICNLLVVRKDMVSLRMLNRLRTMCLKASPNDLKPCILHLKRLIKRHAIKTTVVMYILSIFVKQMFQPMATSVFFAKALHELIFSNVTLCTEEAHMWNIVDCLVSNNFEVMAIFEKFHSLKLLSEHQVRIIMEHKIAGSKSSTPSLKLLGVILQFVPYGDCQWLHKKLEQALNNTDPQSETDQSLVVYSLIKILERKRPEDCDIKEINEYRKMQVLISQTFYDQMFPISCVSYVTALLTVYANLIEEDFGWDVAACSYFEDDFGDKLMAVCNRKLKHHSYLSRDVSYISELIMLCEVTLSQDNFDKLKKIVTVSKHTPAFRGYLKNHQKIWSACILLYIKICFVNSALIPECISNLEMILCSANVHLRLQILYALLDFCNKHFQYYDPLIPHLFKTLHSKNAYARFISSKIIMELVSDGYLRLVDGQYYLFMGLLADDKEIISRSVEVFVKEKFVSTSSQTIARHFVSSIIHYNHYYCHPTLTISEADQDILKRQSYSGGGRFFIYYSLYNCLSDGLKFNILNQICNEILVRILNKTLSHSSKILRILEDVLFIILCTVPKDKIGDINDASKGSKYYSTRIEHIQNNLFVRDLKNGDNGLPAKRATLNNILKTLFQLLYSALAENPKNCQNLLFTIIVLTESFYPIIKYIINEESTVLKGLYKNLPTFYNGMKHHFALCLVTVNPCNLPAVLEKEDIECYIAEFPDFSLMPPAWCSV